MSETNRTAGSFVNAGLPSLALLAGLVAIHLACRNPPATSTSKGPAFYIATNGNDAWTGRSPNPRSATGDGPFLTLQRALEATRKNRAIDPFNAPQKILLRQGSYFLPQTVILTPEDSGIEIAAYRSEKPILSAGRKIDGWRATDKDSKKLWVAPLPEARGGKWIFRELWVNGKRAIRARHPNEGYLEIAKLPDKAAAWTQGQNRFGYATNDLRPWLGATNAELIAMTRWVESRLPILKIEEKERIVSFGKRAVFELVPDDLYYVEGAFEFLDAPGEWFLDSNDGLIYYAPRPGESLIGLQAVAPVLSQILRLEGQPWQQRPITNVRFRGLSFAHAEWYFPEGHTSRTNTPEITPPASPEVGGFAQAAIGVPGAVWAEGIHQCTFEQCKFTCLGNYALELSRGCQSNLISHCEFDQLGAGGVKIGETRLRDRPEDQTRANEISDCHIHDGGQMFHSAIGIWVGESPGNQIVHNLIHDFYYTGISIGWTWGYGPSSASNNLVAFNHVHHIGVKSNGDGPILSDMGGIYTLGKQPGTRIINNLWHDIAGLRYGGWGIYLDEGSSGILAASNVVYHTTHGGFHQHYGETNTLVNNLFALAREFQLQRTRVEPHLSFSVRTNIVYFESGGLLGGDWAGDNYDLDWNLYFDRRLDREMRFEAATPEQWRERGHDRHSLFADPQFLAPDKFDFRLTPGSPAFRIGFQPIDLSQVGPRKE